jgi:hypothetical protein
MLVAASKESAETARVLWKEADELTRIFAAIYPNSSPES